MSRNLFGQGPFNRIRGIVIFSVFSASRTALSPSSSVATHASLQAGPVPQDSSCRPWRLCLLACFLFAPVIPALMLPATDMTKPLPKSAPFELLTRRMDVDVDGAPNAYGPPGSKALDSLDHAHYRGWKDADIVGYLTEDDHPHVPVVQGPQDPFPGLYISQTAFTDPARKRDADVSRYVDATRISYVVLGDEAHAKGARLGDFVAVYSRVTHRSVFGIVGDSGNPSGDEGSLHLLQMLGYPFRDGKHDAVDGPEIVIRYYPHSNPHRLFFHTQAALDEVALREGLSRDFSASPLARSGHPRTH